MTLASSQEPLYTGVYYRSIRPTLLDTVAGVRNRVSENVRPDLEELIEQYA